MTFRERPEFHWKNRSEAHGSMVQPALLANGDPGIRMRIGPMFAVLSKSEATELMRRMFTAIDSADEVAADAQKDAT